MTGKTIALIQVDGTLPNLALMKLATWHKQQGDKVTIIKDKHVTTRLVPFDKVYISCIFDENKAIALEMEKQFENAELGGVGVDSPKKLPPEIEHIMPDYDLFGIDYSVGFTTRGCIRNCYFCKVPKHEGKIFANCDIYEFWDKRHKEIIIMDNNILAMPEHFKKIAKQINDNKLRVDFNQGLDHRLLTPELCKILLNLKHMYEIRFAYDSPSYKPTVIKALKMLRDAGLKDWRTRWYCYIGVNDDFYSAYERIEFLRQNKQLVYVMRDRKVYNKPEFIALSSWANYPGAFKQGTFKEVIEYTKANKHHQPIVDKYINHKKEEKVNKL